MARMALIVSVIAVLLLGIVPPESQAQDSGTLRIVTSTTIVADVTQQIAGDAAVVESLIPIGLNPHTYEPGAQDIVRLSDADLVLIVGAFYEATLESVLTEAAGSNVVVVSGCVPIHPFGGEHEEHEHSAEPYSISSDSCADHLEAANSAFGTEIDPHADPYLGSLYELDCGDYICDPHVWNDPYNVALWALSIRDTLTERDPAHADQYAANTERYLAELAALDQDIQAAIEEIPEGQRFMITNHEALGYFAERYGLSIVGVVIPGGSTTAEPSVQEVLSLIETVQDYAVPAIFTETAVSDDLAQQVADEAGADIIQLYTESLSNPGEGADTYLDYMHYNATTIAEALK
jgi:ABC-type Zn uptake system ZnuABC Zn-binding protein ZnuA